nr:uncharacterized protein LOC127486975 [Oryctolagus cuniculus]
MAGAGQTVGSRTHCAVYTPAAASQPSCSADLQLLAHRVASPWQPLTWSSPPLSFALQTGFHLPPSNGGGAAVSQNWLPHARPSLLKSESLPWDLTSPPTPHPNPQLVPASFPNRIQNPQTIPSTPKPGCALPFLAAHASSANVRRHPAPSPACGCPAPDSLPRHPWSPQPPAPAGCLGHQGFPPRPLLPHLAARAPAPASENGPSAQTALRGPSPAQPDSSHPASSPRPAVSLPSSPKPRAPGWQALSPFPSEPGGYETHGSARLVAPTPGLPRSLCGPQSPRCLPCALPPAPVPSLPSGWHPPGPAPSFSAQLPPAAHCRQRLFPGVSGWGATSFPHTHLCPPHGPSVPAALPCPGHLGQHCQELGSAGEGGLGGGQFPVRKPLPLWARGGKASLSVCPFRPGCGWTGTGPTLALAGRNPPAPPALRASRGANTILGTPGRPLRWTAAHSGPVRPAEPQAFEKRLGAGFVTSVRLP